MGNPKDKEPGGLVWGCRGVRHHLVTKETHNNNQAQRGIRGDVGRLGI